MKDEFESIDDLLEALPSDIKKKVDGTLPAIYQNKLKEVNKIVSTKNPEKLYKKFNKFFGTPENMQYFNGDEDKISKFNDLSFAIKEMASQGASSKEIRDYIGTVDDFLQEYYVFHKD